MTNLNANYAERVVIDTRVLEFVSSPSPGVWRKRLELVGPTESGRVTSIVRYDPGARFPSHDHPGGEEILVIEGEFCDERGCFKAGSYQLNPPGFRHAPFTPTGCTLFVKLRQYGGDKRDTVLVDTSAAEWVDRDLPGVRSLVLYSSPDHPECTRLTELSPHARVPTIELPQGEEIFVLRGEFQDEAGQYGAGTWLRLPARSRHTPRSETGALLYVKSGGFPVNAA